MEIPRSPWRVSLGGMPVTERRVDKQPSVAITIQIEYSYFSVTNLSFFYIYLLTFGSCFSPRRNPRHSPCSATVSGVDYWSGGELCGWAFEERRGQSWVSAGRRAEGRKEGVKECRVNSGGTPRRWCSRNTVPFHYTSTWKHLSGSSLAPRWKPSQANTEAVIRNVFDIDRFLYLSRNNTVER